MTREDIITLARTADVIDFRDADSDPHVAQMVEFLQRFAALVATAERRKHQADIEKWKAEAVTAEKWRGLALSKEGDGRCVQRIQQEAAEKEREACAQAIEDMATQYAMGSVEERLLERAAEAIRARSQQ